jgi:hypothetical protein
VQYVPIDDQPSITGAHVKYGSSRSNVEDILSISVTVVVFLPAFNWICLGLRAYPECTTLQLRSLSNPKSSKDIRSNVIFGWRDQNRLHRSFTGEWYAECKLETDYARGLGRSGIAVSSKMRHLGMIC